MSSQVYHALVSAVLAHTKVMVTVTMVTTIVDVNMTAVIAVVRVASHHNTSTVNSANAKILKRSVPLCHLRQNARALAPVVVHLKGMAIAMMAITIVDVSMMAAIAVARVVRQHSSSIVKIACAKIQRNAPSLARERDAEAPVLPAVHLKVMAIVMTAIMFVDVNMMVEIAAERVDNLHR